MFVAPFFESAPAQDKQWRKWVFLATTNYILLFPRAETVTSLHTPETKCLGEENAPEDVSPRFYALKQGLPHSTP